MQTVLQANTKAPSDTDKLRIEREKDPLAVGMSQKFYDITQIYQMTSAQNNAIFYDQNMKLKLQLQKDEINKSIGIQGLSFYKSDQQYGKQQYFVIRFNKYIIDNMRSQQSKKRKYFVAYEENSSLINNDSKNKLKNIFSTHDVMTNCFPTCPMENSSVNLANPQTINSNRKIIETIKKRETPFVQNQTMYKYSRNHVINYSSNRKVQKTIDSNKHSKLRSVKIPVLKNTMRKQFDSKNQRLNESQVNISRLEKDVDRFLYSQGVASEVAFQQDLKTRCGDQYFQQILRNRHEEQKKTTPFLYNIRKNAQLVQSNFVKLIKQLHPEIKPKQKMKLVGINKKRLRTEPNDFCSLKHKLNNQYLNKEQIFIEKG